MAEPIFYLDHILPSTTDDHPPVLDWPGGPTQAEEEAPPAFVPYPYPRGLRGGADALTGGLV